MDISFIQNPNFLKYGLSAAKIIFILIVAFIADTAGKKFILRAIQDYIRKTAKIGVEISQQRVKTLAKVFSALFGLVVWIICVLTILPELGINIVPLLTGLGVVGLALGMGAKTLIQDYLNGVFILLEDQYRVGEEVIVGDKQGMVEDLSMRRTVLKDLSKQQIYYIPNSQIKQVVNLSRYKK